DRRSGRAPGRPARHALSCVGMPAHGCIARMMRKANRGRLWSDAALLLLKGVALPPCHGSGRAARLIWRLGLSGTSV
ncbi:MAG TPA: hypothetical protein VFJ24_09585, partial [Gaiellales bacterium]|nr:hypothetical protein [Gaiellales bacterium]